MTPAIPDLRQYLTTAYSDEELVALCADYFRDVYENFTVGMTKAAKILLLLDHCQRRELLSNLAAALERDRAEQYPRYFGAEGGERPTRTRSQRNPRQVFVSHAHQDADFAQRLAADLRAAGWHVWIAPDSIRPGEKWVEAINRGLAESSVFVVALTPAAVDSGWVTDETNAAIMLTNKGKMRFIPAELASCDAPPLWEMYHWIPFAGRYANGLAALLATLDPVGAGSPRPVAPPSPKPGRGDHAPTPGVAPSNPVGAGSPRPVAPPAPEPGRGDHAPTPAVVRAPDPAPPAVLTLTSPIRLELVRIPAGEFLMGSDPAVDKDAKDDEQPQHRVYLPDFYIGKVPVTNAQYETFVKATHHRTRAGEAAYGWVWTSRWEAVNGADWCHPRGPETDIAQKADHPVIRVSWYDAVAFCRWLSETTGEAFRLPSEAEWEKAARGTHARIYPWGDEPPDANRCNFDWNICDTTPVDQYPQGATPDYGVLDMAGNVREWTSSIRGKSILEPDFDYPYDSQDGRENQDVPFHVFRMCRGGSWYANKMDVRCADRDWDLLAWRFAYIGFRVARSFLT